MASFREHVSDRVKWRILALLLLCACGKTPVDAIVSEQDGSAPTGDPCVDGAPAATSGLFRLRAVSGGQCLAVGVSTTIGGSPAWLTAMADDCAVAGELWQLIPDVMGLSAGSFELRSTSLPTPASLDIRMGMTADGTSAVVFAPTTFDNQRFFFRARRDGVFELEPGHVMGRTSCLSGAPPFPAIFRCSSSDASQEWQLIPSDCQ